MKNTQKFTFLFFSIFLAFYSCGNGSTDSVDAEAEATVGNTTGVTNTEVKIGTFAPMTGPAALWGNLAKGADAYFKMINEEGGINGRMIKHIIKDDGYDPSKTVPAVRELVQRDEIFAFVGGIGTATSMAVEDYIVENEIPWLSVLSGASHFSIPAKKNVFDFMPYYIDEAVIQAKYAVDDLKATKIAIIYQNDDLGKSGLVGAKSYLKEKNLAFVAEVPVEITDTDLSSHVAKLKESGAEAVLLWTLPRQSVITVTNATVTNFKPQWIASFILSDQALMHQLTKGAWEGVVYGTFGESPYSLDIPKVAKYKAALAKYYPDTRWGAFSLMGFLYVEPFLEALKNAGKELTRERLVAEMENLKDFKTTGMNITYGPNNRQPFRSMRLLKCTGPETFEEMSGEIVSDGDIEALANEL